MSDNEYVTKRIDDVSMFDNSDITEAELVITASKSEAFPEDYPDNEYREMAKEGSENFAGLINLNIEVRVNGKRVSYNQKDPKEYLANGFLVGLLEAIQHGLTSPRGTSIESAIEDAGRKAQSAIRVIKEDRMLESLSKLSLAISDPAGEA